MSKIEEAILKANLERNRRASAPPEREPEAAPQSGIPGRLFVLVAIILAFAAGGAATYCLHGAWSTSSPRVQSATTTQNTPRTVSPSAPDVQRQRPLPACIPVNNCDPAYATHHPGWQRYLGGDLEYRVYRRETGVKAIQVIALNGAIIEQPRFSSFLRETTGAGEQHITSHEDSNGMSVDRGTAGNNTELVVYRAKPGVSIKAFVVEYP